MKISDIYSHMNGEEYFIVHHKPLYDEIKQVIADIDANALKTKISKEKTMKGKSLFNPKELNHEFKTRLESLGWQEQRYSYYITLDRDHMTDTIKLSANEQKEYLEERGVSEHILSYKQTDFIKDKIAIEVQFGKYPFVAYDLFVKHMLFFSGGKINLGVEILPMKSMQSNMSSGIAYFEGEVYNIMRQGRSSPPVPLLIIGIEA